jgi:hypothetical protein
VAWGAGQRWQFVGFVIAWGLGLVLSVMLVSQIRRRIGPDQNFEQPHRTWGLELRQFPIWGLGLALATAVLALRLRDHGELRVSDLGLALVFWALGLVTVPSIRIAGHRMFGRARKGAV